ncbi:short-chain dehydrogenase/reductase SDR [Sistotremastrum niveocremeum HHB9708]|uniref:Short-chain dehydrogenase/reductase SDR n=1 Tax=Sistotremastrum niveocremeum HHB9708 TaxID=1314777 RepID=A0A164V3V8_9AGAM|nr:short-chain dehydrogenase/reductase SDR [Sistotremastrum niveocremeum HHB9708]
MTSLRDQTILIIGGTSGIGYSVAEASLHQQAAHVIVASSTPEKVTKTVARLEETTTKNNLSGKVTGKTLDVSNSDQVKKFFAEIGELDHVVITSGDKLKLGFKGVDLETLKSALDVRFWAAALIAQQARIKKGGSITLTGGVASIKPPPGWPIVAGLAGAAESLVKGLAVDLAPVRVNLVAPGAVLTELWDSLPTDLREKLLQESADKLLVKRVGNPEEIADAYIFLMKCGFITGETLHINGGQTLV